MEETKDSKQKKWTRSIKNFVASNKIITITAIIFTMCFILNLVLIYNFMRILENV